MVKTSVAHCGWIGELSLQPGNLVLMMPHAALEGNTDEVSQYRQLMKICSQQLNIQDAEGLFHSDMSMMDHVRVTCYCVMLHVGSGS